MEWFSWKWVGWLVVIGALVAIEELVKARGINLSSLLDKTPRSVYRLRDDFLSKAELTFYRTLESVVGERAVVLTKVNLGDLVYASGGDKKERFSAWQRINRKHVDYVLCESETMKPLAAIELDDRSHLRSDRQERDKLVDEVLNQTGLPIFHFRPGLSDDFKAVATALTPLFAFEGLASAPSLPGLAEAMIAREAEREAKANQDQVTREVEVMVVTEAEPAVESEPQESMPEGADAGESTSFAQAAKIEDEKTEEAIPLCPKCGSPMVKRVAKQGENKGGMFWGCPNYPRCRGVRQVEA